MLLPIKLHFPARLSANETRTIELEPLLGTTPILLPRLHFLNTATIGTVTVVVRHNFKIGPTDNLLTSANFTAVVATLTVQPGAISTVQLPTAGIDGKMDLHRWTLTNNATTETIVHVWLSGLHDETLHRQPQYPPRIT